MGIILKYKEENGMSVGFSTEKQTDGNIKISGYWMGFNQFTRKKFSEPLKDVLPEEETREWIKCFKGMAEQGFGTLSITQKKE